MSTDSPVRVGIIGPGGIGMNHVRIFHELGAVVSTVLGSNLESSKRHVARISETFGIANCRPAANLEALLGDNIDAVVVSSPPETHAEFLGAATKRSLPVFCEKPLIWWPGATPRSIEQSLEALASARELRILVNTSNASFVSAVLQQAPELCEVDRFKFHFHTNGPNRCEEIGADLLPHALSLLLRCFGRRSIHGIRAYTSEDSYACVFDYGGVRVAFDLRQSKDIPRSLGFSLGDRAYERIATGHAETYRVSLEDRGSGERIDVDDPFRVYTERFLQYCQLSDAPWAEAFSEASDNLRLMAEILGEH